MNLVLEAGLKNNFEEVSVKVVDCPDLTQKPFGLAAEGLVTIVADLNVFILLIEGFNFSLRFVDNFLGFYILIQKNL